MFTMLKGTMLEKTKMDVSRENIKNRNNVGEQAKGQNLIKRRAGWPQLREKIEYMDIDTYMCVFVEMKTYSYFNFLSKVVSKVIS